MKHKLLFVNSLLIVCMIFLFILKRSESKEMSHTNKFYCSCPIDAFTNYLIDQTELIPGHTPIIVPAPGGQKCPISSKSCRKSYCDVHVYSVIWGLGIVSPLVLDIGVVDIPCTQTTKQKRSFTPPTGALEEYIEAVKKKLATIRGSK